MEQVASILKESERVLAVDITTAARMLSSSVKVVKKYIANGSLSAFPLGRTWTIRVEEIQRFMKKQEQLASNRRPHAPLPRGAGGRFNGGVKRAAETN